MKGNRIIRADGKILNAGGCRQSAPRAGTPKYRATRYKSSQLPKKVDLRPYMPKIEDQGDIGSCTANATVGALEYLLRTKCGLNADFSRLFVYYNAREVDGNIDEDCGASVCDAVETLQEIGACSESDWPYEPDLLYRKPRKGCYKSARDCRIDSFECVDVDLDTFRKVLAEGHPIIFGMTLFDSFDRQRKRGYIPMPSRNEMARDSHSSHAMLCVGYSDVDEVFIVRNSWGDRWGDQGYCYIPYSYMMNTRYNEGDCWVIDIDDDSRIAISGEEAEEDWDNEEAWSNDDESVLVDLNDEFGNMDDEQWSAFSDAMGDYDLPYRLGALFAVACAMDDEISDEEEAAAIAQLKKILHIFHYDMSARRVYKRCLHLAGKDGFLEETVEILGNYLSPGALGTIAKYLYEIAGADGLDPEEEEFIDSLVGAWLDSDEEIEELYCDDEDYDDEDDDDDDGDYADDDEDYDDEDDEDYDEDDEDYDDDDDDYDDDDDDDEEDDDDDEPPCPRGRGRNRRR